MNWPTHIRLLSLPSGIFGAVFLWTAILYLLFVKYLPKEHRLRKTYIYFAFACLSLAFYSIGTFNLYSSDHQSMARFWQSWIFICTVPTFIFFVLFSNQTQGNKNFYWNFVVPLITLSFLPFMLYPGYFLTQVPSPKSFSMMGYQVDIPAAALGHFAYAYLAWFFPNTFILAFRWVQSYRRRPDGLTLAIAFVFIVMTAINDTLVAAGVYDFLYIIELGFVIFITAMSLQMFRSYVSTTQKVEQSKQQFQNLNRELRFLMGTIGHDFMAPLLSIRGFVDLIQEELSGKEPKSQHYLKRISANAEHMRSLMQDLVTYLRIGRVEETHEKVNVEKIFQEALVMIDLPAQKTKVKIQAPEQWPQWEGCPRRMKQIFLNLIQNSLKHAANGSLNIGFKTEPKKNGVLFTVEDNGPGIPRDLQEKVFDTFYRSNPQTQGTGMGLSIIKKIIEYYGGKIWIDPQYHQGTRIQFFLPNATSLQNSR